ncbi:helix-turn-helix domain-containing protein [Arcobacter sp. CECT 8985]|uniref:helix-turn-helix domain-containing protein n=1 Tax=Arcobacter sp. CECT 8985 TaxID=1935424 RepID=UPI00100C026B|nr:helix-turn-helix transcriptional regulator [Arcobacter sp. CECT 8985]RXJ83727.1 transcriptional regulator [Arcobacter sp. CECT 8985]
MEIFERINQILKEKKMTKKEFAARLLAVNPKVNRLGEAPSVSSIYAYLNGTSSIKADFIPYIAEALNVAEQELFEDNSNNRNRYLKYILKDLSKNELELIKNRIEDLCHWEQAMTEQVEKIYTYKTNKDKIDELISLLPYMPDALYDNVVKKVREIKEFTDSY